MPRSWSAEGSNLRQDLQSSISFASATVVSVQASTTATIANNTGYWRFQGNILNYSNFGCAISINDGSTDKIIFNISGSGSTPVITNKDFIVYLTAGDSLIVSNGSAVVCTGNIRQIATIDGELVDPN